MKMIALKGTYENGKVKLDEEGPSLKKTSVIITFLEDFSKGGKKKKLKFEDFSFRSSREETKRYKGSISDSVIEERRSAQ